MSSRRLRGVATRSTRYWNCGEFFPLTRRCKAVEIDERNAVDHGVADLDYAAESGKSLLIDLFMCQQFRIVEEISQKPPELPHGFLRAVETTHNGLTQQSARLDNGKPENIEGLGCVPAELGAINTNEEDAVGNLWARIASSFGKTADLTFHATTSCAGRV